VAFRKKLYRTLEELQADLDAWLAEYNRERSHSGKYCFGKTPMQTFLDSRRLAQEKMLDRTRVSSDNPWRGAELDMERSIAERMGGAGGVRVAAASQ
jgi:hypothetical protein